MCDRVALMDAGSIQAEGTQEELISLVGGVDTVVLGGRGDLEAAERALSAIPAVQRTAHDAHGLRLSVIGAPTAVTSIVTAAAGAGMTLADVQIQRPDLESVFLHLTGKALRD